MDRFRPKACLVKKARGDHRASRHGRLIKNELIGSRYKSYAVDWNPMPNLPTLWNNFSISFVCHAQLAGRVGFWQYFLFKYLTWGRKGDLLES